MKIIKLLLAFSVLFVHSAIAQQKINPSELPPGATAFLEKHFKGNAIEMARKNSDHGEKGFGVMLANGTEVEFWKDGGWREVNGHGKPIPTAFLSAMITDYVDKNYLNEKITHIDYGGKDLVVVELTKKIVLNFDKSGRFLKAD